VIPCFGPGPSHALTIGFRYGTSGISDITEKSQNLVTAQRMVPSRFIHCFHGRCVWSLTSPEVILLLDFLSPVSPASLRRSPCAGWSSLIIPPAWQCAAYGSF